MNPYLRQRKWEECLAELWSSLCSEAFGTVSSCTQKMSPLVLHYSGYFGDKVSFNLITHSLLSWHLSVFITETTVSLTLDTGDFSLVAYLLSCHPDKITWHPWFKAGSFILACDFRSLKCGRGGRHMPGSSSVVGSRSSRQLCIQANEEREKSAWNAVQVTASRACPWAHFW